MLSKQTKQKFLPLPQYQTTKKLEDRSYLHTRFSVNKDDFNCWIFDHFPKNPNLKILELGCGTGILWIKNLKRIPSSWKLTLTDLSPAMIAKTKENLSELKNNMVFKLVDAQKIPFKNHSFDLVIANHMLYHVHDRKEALSEIKRVLKPNGFFFAAANGRRHMEELNELLSEFEQDLRLRNKNFVELFNLEDGAKQLTPFFSKVETEKFPDQLRVTQIKPLVDYILSTRARKILTGTKLNEFTSLLESKLKKGPIVITKEVGLFKASNG